MPFLSSGNSLTADVMPPNRSLSRPVDIDLALGAEQDMGRVFRLAGNITTPDSFLFSRGKRRRLPGLHTSSM
jgi:hypothetical protein